MIPRPDVAEVRERNRWRMAHFISPSVVDLSFSQPALERAAWYALARVPNRAPVVAELAYLASQVDALGRASAAEYAFLDEMRLPEMVDRRVRAEMGPVAPLLDARCLLWLITELCAASASWRPSRPPELDGEAREAVGMLFPLLGRSGIPYRREVYRAVWCLHDSFSLGANAPGETDDDGMFMLAMFAAHTVGVRLFGDVDDHLFRAAEMWAIADDDPAVVGRDVVPSAIRSEFERTTGLGIRDFLALTLLSFHELRTRFVRNQEALPALHRVRDYIAAGREREFVRVLDRHMCQSPRQLGRRVLAEMDRYGIEYRSWGSVPQHATEAIRDRPLLDLPRGKFPMGHGLFLDRAAELPTTIHARRHGLSRRKAKGQVGHLFEARLQHRIDRLRPRTWVATEQELDAVVDREDQRPDAIIRDATSFTYLAVEIHAGRLETGVASGNIPSVRDLVNTYITKRGQADALIQDAPAVIGALVGSDHVRVDAVVPLVVTNEALPINPAFERAVRDKDPGCNPRFVCSVDEFEHLLDLAEAGWDVAGLVRNWQAQGGGQMLGTYLRGPLEFTRTGTTLRDRFFAALVEDADLAA